MKLVIDIPEGQKWSVVADKFTTTLEFEGSVLLYTDEENKPSGAVKPEKGDTCKWKRSGKTFKGSRGIVSPHSNYVYSECLGICNTCGKRIEVVK